jgi:riboflavin biosynthesis pyrimidine reductase
VQRIFRRDDTTVVGMTPQSGIAEVIDVRNAMTFHRAHACSVELCMITTPDGVTDVHGRSGPLGSDTDREVLLTLRDNADAVLVGAGTVRAETYGVPKRSPLPIVVVSNSCDLNWDSPLFTSQWGMVATTVSAPRVPVRSFRAGTDAVDLAGIVNQLHNDLGAQVIHVEGGPMLNSALLTTGLVDAINLTIAPFVGHGGSGMTAPIRISNSFQNGNSQLRFALTQMCRDGDYLFIRYERS